MLIIGENIHIIAPPVKAAIEARDAGTIQRMAVAQVEAGVQAFQLFDTWAVLLSLLLAALVKFNIIRVVGW